MEKIRFLGSITSIRVWWALAQGESRIGKGFG